MTRTQRTWVVTAATAAIVLAANVSDGAYFSQSWGWVALAFLVPTTVLLIVDRVTTPGRLRIVFAGFIAAFGVWIALSALWSISSSASLREAERVLVYLALALAVALVLRRGDSAGVLAGIALGVTLVSAYALAARLFPDRFDARHDPLASYRLAEPLGYWNALGLLAAMGLLLGLAFAAHSRHPVASVLGAATVPILATTLYFTFSRGAWLALAVGVVAAAVADPRRLRLLWTSLAVGIPSALCVVYASQQDALTTESAAPLAAAREGHRFAAVVVAAVAGSMFAAYLARTVAGRRTVSRRSRRAFDVGLAGLAVAIVLAAVAFVGGPSAAIDSFEARFISAPGGGDVTDDDLNKRLFSIAGNGRSLAFRIAWDAARERPLVGQGSGTFEYLWYERRPDQSAGRDAHSLYVETLAELGLVGMALLGAVLLVLAFAGVRARRRRFVASGLGAFVAWSAASAFDWHWEMVGVTLTALLAGAAGLLASERGSRPRSLDGRARAGFVAVTIALSVAAVWSLVGNQALFAAREAIARDDWQAAREHARRAQALLVWSYEPDIAVGDAAAGSGDREGALRAYRQAVAADGSNWLAWLRLAQVARGAERRAAYDQADDLNPRQDGVPDN